MKKLYAPLFLLLLALLFNTFSCKKSEIAPDETTNPPAAEPFKITITTGPVSSISDVAATFGGTITTSGPGTISDRGICWSTATLPTIQNGKVASGSGTGTFAANSVDLVPAAQYFVKAYAIDDKGLVYYGNEVTFTTSATTAVTILTRAATEIGDKSAVVGATFSLTSAHETLKETGVAFALIASPIITGDKIIAQPGSATEFSAKHQALTAGTKYYARAYIITNTDKVFYGNQIEFTTSGGITLPPVNGGNNSLTVSTMNASTITTNSANTGGTAAINGLETVSARGVCYSTAANPTVSHNKITSGAGQGSFQSNLTGLTASTKYYVRAFATNPKGEQTYGNQIEFTTNAAATNPPPANSISVTTTAVSAITSTSVISGGNVTVSGLETAYTRGLCWATTANPTVYSQKTSSGTGAGAFQSSITGLTPSTSYYVRAYSISASGTATYGNELRFTTTAPAVPTSSIQLTTGPANVISNSWVKLQGSVTNPQNEVITQKGIMVGTKANSTDDPIYLDFSTSNPFELDIKGVLTPGITYYARTTVLTSTGVKVFGNTIIFTLNSTAEASLDLSYDPWKVNSTTAQAYLRLTIENGSSVKFTAVGVCYHTSPNVSIQNSVLKHQSTSAGGMALDLSGLKPSTTYYSKGYATTTDGKTYYSPETSFKTADPGGFTVTTRDNGIWATSISGRGEILTKDNALVFSSRGFYWGKTNTPSTNGTKINLGSGLNEFTHDITGLTPETDYYIQAFGTTSTGTTVLGPVILMRTKALPVDPPPVVDPPTNPPTDPPTNPPTNPPTGGPDDILITLVAFNKATVDCPEGSGLFKDAKGYIYKVINKKVLDAERASADAKLKSTYGAGTDITYKTSAFTTNRYAVAIQYKNKHAGWDCRTVVISFAFGKTKAEALSNAIKDKVDNVGNVAHTVLKELNW